MTTSRRPAAKKTATAKARRTSTTSRRTTTRSTTKRRRTTRTPTTRRRRANTATTIGAGIGTLVVAALLGASWPVRVGLVVLVLLLGLASLLWARRREPGQ